MNEATQCWRQLQAGIEDSAAWTQEVLATVVSSGPTYKGHPALLVAEPYLITQSEMAADAAVSRAVLAALVASGRRLLAEPALQDRYAPGFLDSIPDSDLFSVDAGYSEPVVFGRIDGVRTAEGLQVLEFNGGLPGGIMGGDRASAIMAETDIGAQFGRRYPFSAPVVAEDVIDALVATWHDFGGAGSPYTVVALPEELTELAGPPVEYLAGIARARGIELTVADPAELVFSHGRLRLAGREVDVLVRAFFTTMFGYLGDRLDGIKAALRAQAVCMITSLQSGLFGVKSLFAMVTDPAVDLDLPAADRALAQAHIPWTRVVAPGPSTDAGGSAIDLLGHLAANREQLVVKPVDGSGGAGVELGWTHSADSWRAVIDRAAAGGHVVQQRIVIPTQEFSLLEPGFPTRGFQGDHNPMICNGEMASCVVRLAPEGSGITNVAGGASVAPVFVLEG